MTAAPVIQAVPPNAGHADLTHETVPVAARQRFGELVGSVNKIARTMQATAATPAALKVAEQQLEEIERKAYAALLALKERQG